MKTLVLLVSFLTASISYAQSDTAFNYRTKEITLITYPDSLTRELLEIPIENYLGKEVYNFLLNDTVRRYYDELSFLDYYKHNSLNGVYLSKKLADSSIIGIEIFVKKFVHQKSVSADSNWDMEKLLKENMTGVLIIWFRGSNGRILLKEAGNTYYLDKE
jgi:hypothetical protein